MMRRLLLVLLCLPSLVWAAIAFDNGGVATGSGPTAALSLTVGSGTNRLLVCHIMWGHTATITVSSVAVTGCGSASLTQLAGTAVGTANNFQTDTWYLKAPPSGACTITSTMSGPPNNSYVLGCESYSGVDQTSTFGTPTTGTGTTASASITVTGSAGDYIDAAIGAPIFSAIVNANSSAWVSNDGTKGAAGQYQAYSTGIMSWTGLNQFDGEAYAASGVAIHANVGPPPYFPTSWPMLSGYVPLGSFTISAVPSRTSGTGPLAVEFDMSGTVDTIDNPLPNAFHGLSYYTTFGDAGGDSKGNTAWTSGTQSSPSMNTCWGPECAHVYDPVPGSGTQPHTATHYACYGAITIGGSPTCSGNMQTTSEVITVSDPNVTFAATNTICVSAAGTFTNCPSGATHATRSDFDGVLNTYMGSGTRVLFHAGESYTSAAGYNFRAINVCDISSYDTGALPVITVGSATQTVLGFNSNVTMADCRIHDLSFSAGSFTTTTAPTLLGANGNGVKSQWLLYRVTTSFFAVPFLFDASTVPDQIFMVGNTINNTSGEDFVWATHFAMMGNTFTAGVGSANTGGILNMMRLMGPKYGVVSNNTVAGITSSGGSDLSLRTHSNPSTDPVSGNYVVSDNLFNAGANFFAISIQPSTILDNSDTPPTDVIIERNWLLSNNSSTGGPGVSEKYGNRVSIRDNLVDVSGSAQLPGIEQVNSSTGGTNVVTNSYIYNNTIYDSAAYNSPQCVLLTSGVGFVVENNLCYMPAATTPVMVGVGSATIITQSNNSTDSQVLNTDPKLTYPPNTIAKWKPAAGSYSIGAGASVPVYEDFNLVSWPTTWDIGAIHH